MARIVFIILFLMTSLGAQAEPADPIDPVDSNGPIRAGIFIGVNQGNYFDDPLFYAQKDAEKIMDVISKLGALNPGLTLLLKEPTSGEVMEKLQELKERIAIAKAYQDGPIECIFYYSGHSGLDGLHIRGNTVSYKQLYDRIKGLGCQLRIIIIDACNSGGLLGLKGVKLVKEKRVDVHSIDEGEVIITSSAKNEYSQEKDEFRGSIFTHYFVTGLLGEADYSRDQIITLSEAYQFAYKNTLQETFGSSHGLQHPSYQFNIRGYDDIPLTVLSRVTGRVLIPSGKGNYTFLDVRRGIVFGAFEQNGSQRTVVLPQGKYIVRYQNGDGIFEIGELTVGEKTTDLEDSVLRKIAAFDDPIKGSRRVYLYSIALTGGVAHDISGKHAKALTPFIYGGEIRFTIDGLIVPHQTLGFHFGFFNGKEKSDLFDNPLTTRSQLYELAIDVGFIWRLGRLIDLATIISPAFIMINWSRETPYFKENAFVTGFRGVVSLENQIKVNRHLKIILPAVRAALSIYRNSQDNDMHILFHPGVFIGLEVWL